MKFSKKKLQVKSEQVTTVAELIFNSLLEHMTDDETQLYSNIFNRAETDPEVVILANRVLSGEE